MYVRLVLDLQRPELILFIGYDGTVYFIASRVMKFLWYSNPYAKAKQETCLRVCNVLPTCLQSGIRNDVLLTLDQVARLMNKRNFGSFLSLWQYGWCRPESFTLSSYKGFCPRVTVVPELRLPDMIPWQEWMNEYAQNVSAYYRQIVVSACDSSTEQSNVSTERNDSSAAVDSSAERNDSSAERNDSSAERNDSSAERNDSSAERNDSSADVMSIDLEQVNLSFPRMLRIRIGEKCLLYRRIE